jgi:hypothetical protein
MRRIVFSRLLYIPDERLLGVFRCSNNRGGDLLRLGQHRDVARIHIHHRRTDILGHGGLAGAGSPFRRSLIDWPLSDAKAST